jgi:hypothetical protein
MSQIRRRGNSLQVHVLAGTGPLTGKRLYLSELTTDLAEAKRIQLGFAPRSPSSAGQGYICVVDNPDRLNSALAGRFIVGDCRRLGNLPSHGSTQIRG